MSTYVGSICALLDQCSGTYKCNVAIICSVIYDKYVYSACCHMGDCSDFICVTWLIAVTSHVAHICVIFGTYAEFGGFICF